MEHDAIASVLGVLRESLQRQINAADGASAEASRLNCKWTPCETEPRSDDVSSVREITNPSAVLLANIAALHPSRISAQSLASYTVTAPRVEALRQSRSRLRLQRELLRRRFRRVDDAEEAAHQERVGALRQLTAAFGTHGEAVVSNSMRRLQALCVECIAEMDKAVGRVTALPAPGIQREEEDRFFEAVPHFWRWRWSLFVARLNEDFRGAAKSELVWIEDRSKEVPQFVRALERQISTRGPVLSGSDRVVIDTVVSVAKDGSNVENTDETRCRKPSLHFTDSISSAWNSIPSSIRFRTVRLKSRRSATPRQLSKPVNYASSLSRRVVAPPENRLSALSIDTPLSSSCIAWLLYTKVLGDVGPNQRLFQRDSNVYVALNLQKLPVPPGEHGDVAKLVNTRNEYLQLLRIAATRPEAPELTVRTVFDGGDGLLYVPATVLELIRTSYVSNSFIHSMKDDLEPFENSYPTWIRSGPPITTLHVVMTSRLDNRVILKPLPNEVLHELCVLYLARGVCTNKSRPHIIDCLALADASFVLPRARSEDSRFCVAEQPSCTAIQHPVLFVEYHLEPSFSRTATFGDVVCQAEHSPATRAIATDSLASVCTWRSCLDSSDAPPLIGVKLCHWHRALQSSLHDIQHFIPDMNDLRDSLRSTSTQHDVGAIKEVCMKSSSLLKELTNHQLGASIESFLRHSKLGISNAKFETQVGYTEEDSPHPLTVELVASPDRRRLELQSLTEIQAIERTITSIVRAATKCRVSLCNVEDELVGFSAGIRTNKLELLLQLSRQRLGAMYRFAEKHLHAAYSKSDSGLGRALSEKPQHRAQREAPSLHTQFSRPRSAGTRLKAWLQIDELLLVNSAPMVEEKESIVTLATALAAVRAPELSFTKVFDRLNDVEQHIFRHKDAYGACNALFQQGCEEFILLCNTAAIQQLSRAAEASSDIQKCSDLLMRAEQHTRRSGYLRSASDQQVSSRLQLRILSLNNLACFNKHVGKPLTAIEALEEVLELQLRNMRDIDRWDDNTRSDDSRETAIAHTHLNLSAVLSQLHRHSAAAEHARSAINLLCQSQQEGCSIDGTVLAVAHYNLAVELEHLRDIDQVKIVVKRGLDFASEQRLHRDSSEIMRLLEDMRRCFKDKVPPRRSPVQPRRPLSPRSLRQRV